MTRDREVKFVPTNQIRPSKLSLRELDRKRDGFAELVQSVKHNGILNPIVLREVKDPENGESFYGIIDGLQRFSAAQDAGLKEVPAQIMPMEDDRLLFAQIIANAQRVNTKPAEFARQINRILAHDPTLTVFDIANKLDMSSEWIYQVMNINRIVDERIRALIDEKKIPVSTAMAMSKLPKEEHANWVERAMTQNSVDVVKDILERVREIRNAKHQGRDVRDSNEFKPISYLKKLKEIEGEKNNNYREIHDLMRRFNVTTVGDTIKFVLDWVLNLDPKSIEVQKQEFEEKKEKDKQKKLKQQEEKAALKKKEVSKELAQMGLGDEEL